MRIDSHQHFWKLERGDYAWLTPESDVLYRDFLPADISPAIRSCSVVKTIAVQAAPTLAETEYLLSLAEGNDFISGVIGWVDMADPDAPATIGRLAEHSFFVGIRPMIQDIPDSDWILNDALGPAFEALLRHQLSFDALVRPQHLNNLRKLVQRYPDLRVVINHAAKPDICSGLNAQWSAQMQALAESGNVYCKFSGLVTEAGEHPTRARIQPFADVLLNWFGPSRLMWGSDWPVVNLAMTYQNWDELSRDLLRDLDTDEQSAILGGTAHDCYRIC